jgi:DNA-directed RNA polymerase specialized sigma24 family protein
MTAVMEQFLTTYPSLPGELQAFSFVHTTAITLALTATRHARLAAARADLWHDPQHRSSTPVVDLAALQQDGSSRAWDDLILTMKPRTLGLLRQEGLSQHDAEDLFAESIAGMVKPRGDGTAVIQDLLVYEQLPALFLTIVKRRHANHLRYQQAQMRALENTVALDTIDDELTSSNWAAEAADPFSGLTLARLAEECAHTLTPLQQHILSVLYIEESASYMEVASATWFVSAVGLKASASEATRRRALDAQHDSALDQLARSLGIDRQKS